MRGIMGIPVIAIEVPTVVSIMATVAYDCIGETLLGQGFSQEETDIFLRQMSNEKKYESGLLLHPKILMSRFFLSEKQLPEGLTGALNSIILN